MSLSTSKVDSSFTQSLKNCTKCDMDVKVSLPLPASSPTVAERLLHLTKVATVSHFRTSSPVSLLKSPLPRVSSHVEPRSTVIETTVAPTTTNLDAVQDDEPSLLEHNDASASSSMTTAPTAKSTAYPQFGLGQFSHREVPHENGDDDEDFAFEDDLKDSYTSNRNVVRTSLADDDHDNNDKPEYRENDDNMESFNEQMGGHFDDDIFKVVHKRERKLIIGNKNLLPVLLDNDLNMQISFEHGAFEGCYCDHHYRITTIKNDAHNTENHNMKNKSDLTSNSTDQQNTRKQENVFCFCTGESVVHFPSNFSHNVRKMYVTFLLHRNCSQIIINVCCVCNLVHSLPRHFYRQSHRTTVYALRPA